MKLLNASLGFTLKKGVSFQTSLPQIVFFVEFSLGANNVINIVVIYNVKTGSMLLLLN